MFIIYEIQFYWDFNFAFQKFYVPEKFFSYIPLPTPNEMQLAVVLHYYVGGRQRLLVVCNENQVGLGRWRMWYRTVGIKVYLPINFALLERKRKYIKEKMIAK